MSLPHTTTNVKARHGDYDVVMARDAITSCGPLLRKSLGAPFTTIITDENLKDLHLPPLQKTLSQQEVTHQSIVLPAGEEQKTMAQAEKLCHQLIAQGMERGQCILALGGGVVGDLAGFAASMLYRGIGIIHIPTTLLAQVDSSIGGKTGVNTTQGKNLLGAFHSPRMVLVDPYLLRTLPPRAFKAGYAEVVKYAILGDADFFTFLEENLSRLMSFEGEVLSKAIHRCVEMKAAITSVDEMESHGGTRALLNLGHTFGHALETLAGHEDCLAHGEAVAVGMVLAAKLSAKLGKCPPKVADDITTHLQKAGLPTSIQAVAQMVNNAQKITPTSIVSIMERDKKTSQGKPSLILLKAMGKAYLDRSLSFTDIENFLKQDMNECC